MYPLVSAENWLQMSLILAEQSIGPITLLELGERFTADSIVELRDHLEELALQGRQLLLFDCRRITLIDSLGIGALVRNWVSRRKHGGSLKLLRPSPRMQEVLGIVGLSKLIESFDNFEDALRSF